MRRKVRNYPSKNDVETMFNDFFMTHQSEVINYMLKESGYKDLETLQEDEMNMKIGYCGLVQLKARNKDQYHEWFLDNYRYPDYASPYKWPYNTQIIDLKEYQIKYALNALGLNDQYKVVTQLL